MHSNETEKALTLLTERLERLEKQNRWLVRIALAMGAVLLLVVTLGAVPSPPYTQPSVRTKNLQVVDQDGNLRAALGVIDGNPSFFLYDEYGSLRALLGFSGGEPGLGLYDEEGTLRAGLSLNVDGSPSLYLSDEKVSSSQTSGSVSGSGQTAKMITLNAGVAVFHVTGNSTLGGTPFVIQVQLKDSQGAMIDLLANEIGSCSVSKVTSIPYSGEYFLDISCYGDWTITWE